jgi:dienelactone hydrolase
MWAAAKPDWDALRQQIRQTLRVPDPLPQLAVKTYGRFVPAKDVAADRVSFATDYGLRVPAIVYHQAGATIARHPALIIVNGHGGDKSSSYAYSAGILYARAGAVVLTYDPIGEYERNWQKRSGTRQHDTPFAPPLASDDMARRLAGLMIADIMQATRYLAERTDVEPKNIAVVGFSMGSFISSIDCALDTSVHACVLVGGGDLDGPGDYWDNSAPMCQGIPYQSLRFLGDRGPVLYALNAKRGPTLVYNGSADKVVDIPNHGEDFFANLRQQTVALLGNKKDVFDYEFFPNGGHQPYFLTKPVALWLNEKLKFPNWTKKQLQAMPETLATDIPEVSRADLRSIPDAVWEADQDSYIYESWRDRARAAIQGQH